MDMGMDMGMGIDMGMDMRMGMDMDRDMGMGMGMDTEWQGKEWPMPRIPSTKSPQRCLEVSQVSGTCLRCLEVSQESREQPLLSPALPGGRSAVGRAGARAELPRDGAGSGSQELLGWAGLVVTAAIGRAVSLECSSSPQHSAGSQTSDQML